MIRNSLLIFFLCPLMAAAQAPTPRFENDTLYTSCGYKIYEGQMLQLAKGTSAAAYFNYIKFHVSMGRNNTYSLQQCTILVSKLKSFKYSNPDNNSIRIYGTTNCPNGKKEDVDIIMNFEKATESRDGMAAELTVPDEFKKIRIEPVAVETKKQPETKVAAVQPANGDLKKLLIADEIKKLFDLYKAGALTKEEYEMQKKKLLEH